MLSEVKKCAEARDIKGLRYIFVDCLDVDPTFEKYKEDYEYCKSIEGLFDSHQPLNGISPDENDWTTDYWAQLKLDLMKNFSMTRFEHMIAVAKVVYSDKIARLISERGIGQEKQPGRVQTIPAQSNSTSKTSDVNISHESRLKADIVVDASKPLSDAELRQAERIAESRRKLEEENQKIEAELAAQKARIEASEREPEKKQGVTDGETGSKKALGIVLAIIAIVVVVIIIIALH